MPYTMQHKDTLMHNNLISIEKEQARQMEQLLRAYIQQYNNRLIDNRMTISK
jgi:alkyl hydroperoxide reductase subunit AhpF